MRCGDCGASGGCRHPRIAQLMLRLPSGMVVFVTLKCAVWLVLVQVHKSSSRHSHGLHRTLLGVYQPSRPKSASAEAEC